MVVPVAPDEVATNLGAVDGVMTTGAFGPMKVPHGFIKTGYTR